MSVLCTEFTNVWKFSLCILSARNYWPALRHVWYWRAYWCYAETWLPNCLCGHNTACPPSTVGAALLETTLAEVICWPGLLAVAYLTCDFCSITAISVVAFWQLQLVATALHSPHRAGFTTAHSGGRCSALQRSASCLCCRCRHLCRFMASVRTVHKNEMSFAISLRMSLNKRLYRSQ